MKGNKVNPMSISKEIWFQIRAKILLQETKSGNYQIMDFI